MLQWLDHTADLMCEGLIELRVQLRGLRAALLAATACPNTATMAEAVTRAVREYMADLDDVREDDDGGEDLDCEGDVSAAHAVSVDGPVEARPLNVLWPIDDRVEAQLDH